MMLRGADTADPVSGNLIQTIILCILYYIALIIFLI